MWKDAGVNSSGILILWDEKQKDCQVVFDCFN